MSDPGKDVSKLGLFMLLLTMFCFQEIVKFTIPRDFRATVVKVYGKTGHGSGSVIYSDNSKSLILTNRHVCDGIAYTDEEIKKLNSMTERSAVCLFDPYSKECAELMSEYDKFLKSINSVGRIVTIKFNNLKHQDVTGIIKRVGNDVDLCIVETNIGNLPEMQLSRTDAVPGDKITSIGNPKYMTNHQTQGFVGDEIEYEGRPYQQHSGIIMGGNSGGPVVNERGEQVGVNTLGTPDPTASYMIPLREIKKFLAE